MMYFFENMRASTIKLLFRTLMGPMTAFLSIGILVDDNVDQNWILKEDMFQLFVTKALLGR